MKKAYGITPACFTIWDENGEFNQIGMEKYITWLLDQGAQSLSFCGSTGENIIVCHADIRTWGGAFSSNALPMTSAGTAGLRPYIRSCQQCCMKDQGVFFRKELGSFISFWMAVSVLRSLHDLRQLAAVRFS